jgi:predicted ATPase
LNDPLCFIGNAGEALSQFATENHVISFLLEGENNEKWNFQFDVADKFDDTFVSNIGSRIIELHKHSLSVLFSNDFQYISSSRWANLNLYPIDSYAVEKEKQLSLNYGQGELVAQFLDYYKGGGNNQPVEKIKTRNVGFGISYSLPVVVALLSAKKGALLIIENPEAHLHPHGQAKPAELMVLVAQSGVQIFVETHSDHIFNGFRKAIQNLYLHVYLQNHFGKILKNTMILIFTNLKGMIFLVILLRNLAKEIKL